MESTYIKKKKIIEQISVFLIDDGIVAVLLLWYCV